MALIVLFSVLCLSPFSFSEEAMIVKVIDVDRFLLSTGEEVECLGIYIPVLGKRFKEEVILEIEKLISQKSLRLEFDTNGRTAPSGKFRAYLFADGMFINGELVKRGYAFLLPSSEKLKYGSRLVRLEEQARAEKRGLWNEKSGWAEPCDCH